MTGLKMQEQFGPKHQGKSQATRPHRRPWFYCAGENSCVAVVYDAFVRRLRAAADAPML
jgi:hypothetical protein